jgi:Ca2+-binding EF-hand superfamily protein
MNKTLPMLLVATGVFLAGCETVGRITSARLSDEKIDTAFKLGNPDNDGTFDRTEATRFGIAPDIFAKANPDNDGTLDKKEFATAIRLQFEKANPDNDSTLDEKEAAAAGVRSSTVFRQANPDNDGTLDIAEYLDALTIQARSNR